MERLRGIIAGAPPDIATVVGLCTLGESLELDASSTPLEFAKVFLSQVTDDCLPSGLHRVELAAFFVDLCFSSQVSDGPEAFRLIYGKCLLALSEAGVEEPAREHARSLCSSFISDERLVNDKDLRMETQKLFGDLGYTEGYPETIFFTEFVLPILPASVLYAVDVTDETFVRAELFGEEDYEDDYDISFSEKDLYTPFTDLLEQFFLRKKPFLGVDSKGCQTELDLLSFAEAFVSRPEAAEFFGASAEVGPKACQRQFVIHSFFYRILICEGFEGMGYHLVEELAKIIFSNPEVAQAISSVMGQKSAHYYRPPNRGEARWNFRTLREIFEDYDSPELVAYLPTVTKASRS